jgi:hypothetical protein
LSAPANRHDRGNTICHALRERLFLLENGQKTKDRNNMDPNSLIVLVVVILALVVGAVIGSRLRRK